MTPTATTCMCDRLVCSGRVGGGSTVRAGPKWGGAVHRVPPPSEVGTAVYSCSRRRAVRLRKGSLGPVVVKRSAPRYPTRAISVRKITRAGNGFIFSRVTTASACLIPDVFCLDVGIINTNSAAAKTVMKVQHAEEAFGSSAGRYGGGATDDTSAAIRVSCRRREDSGTCCDRSAAAKTAATTTINRSDSATVSRIDDDCKNCTAEQRRVRKPRRRSGSWPRTRSLNAPSPVQQFGPCGRIMKTSALVTTIQDPASQRLTWSKNPLSVLVIKKVRDMSVLPPFIELVRWLIQEKSMIVFVEHSVMEDTMLSSNSGFMEIREKLNSFQDGKDDLTDKIDFIICLGGDGTLLYASLLFQQSVPPVMAFHLGSLGFLTPFKFDNFQQQVTNVLEGHAALTLRSRLRCIIVRKNEDKEKPQPNLLVLNEVVIDRGPSPYLSNIDLFLDGKYITSVQGDGLIVSTPTGSTAYAVAAGASMIHPSVPAIMVTPICPHSLSFRPIVVPAGVELKIMLSPDARSTAWVSFDGRNQQELCADDSLRVTTSIFSLPSICAQDQISDWFDSLAECLHWNVRKRQKHFEELSDLAHCKYEDLLNSTSKDTLLVTD